MAWEHEVDLVVAGSGAGGLTAALVAAHEGLDVLLCEKAPQLGGTTATSGGAIWIPVSSEALEAGITDTLQDARLYLKGELQNQYREEMVEAFLTNGRVAVDYLRRNSEVRFELMSIPDYHPDKPGGAKAGRTLRICEFDGRLLGDGFDLVRPPVRRMMVLGGMMFGRNEVVDLIRPYSSWSAFKNATKILFRYFRDRLRYSRGTRLLLGNAMVARYVYSLREKGVGIWVNAPLKDLVVEEGEVVGAVVERDGRPVTIRARRGVVLATGGVAHNAGLLRELKPDFPHEYSIAAEGDTGDGLMIARKAGAVADLNVASAAVWTPASVLKESDGTKSVLPYGYLDRGKPGVIAVNRKGERFVNEANSYHDFVMAMYAHQAEDHLDAYLICDSDFIHDYGFGCVPPYQWSVGKYVRNGYIETGSTLDELAGKIGVDPTGLRRTVDEHNEYARNGVDMAFHKGDTAFNRFNGDARSQPNPCLRPLRKAPFFALRVHPATIGMSVGLKTDGFSRVLDGKDHPIKGLWAVGNDQTTVMAGHCPAGGITLGPAIVFGYRAAMDAVSAHDSLSDTRHMERA